MPDYLESWFITYINLLLTLGLATMGITIMVIVTTKLFRVLFAEYKQYQPSYFSVITEK